MAILRSNLVATVVAVKFGDKILSGSETIPVKVKEIVLNLGTENGIKDGSVFSVYSLGPEIFDHSNGESLGKIEVVKGRGKVIHLQDKMCIIRSNEIIRTKNPLFNSLVEPEAKEYINIRKSFENIAIGDFAKLIA